MIIVFGLYSAVATIIITALGWYIYRLIIGYRTTVENILDLNEELILFRDHLKIVYEMESFYGDEVLQNLLRHSIDVSKYIETFEDEFVKQIMKDNDIDTESLYLEDGEKEQA